MEPRLKARRRTGVVEKPAL